MKFSQLFVNTLKESPKDAVLKSHQYLVRGGFIQQIGSGIYNFLPLGKKLLDKVRFIVKEEMDKSGAQEILMGFVTPAELWRESGRYEKYGRELLRFVDRKDNEFVLGPTHEEVITHIARSGVKSYKQLPIHLYQIHTKFRDELRPRFGLMRGREFIMKDGYSFHSSYEDLDREFDTMEETYKRILQRMGVDFKIVEADSGAIGGSGSKEFMVLAPCGEDTIVVCQNCDYGANIEASKRAQRTSPRAEEVQYDSNPPKAEFARFHTPDTKTIESVSVFFKVDRFYIMKAIVKKALKADGSADLAFFFVRGDDEAEEVKMLNAINKRANVYLELVDVSVEEIEKAGLSAGFIGAYGLRHITQAEHIYFDESLRDAEHLICGANEKDYHFVGVDLSTFADLEYADLASTKEGDLCPKCGGRLHYTKGIEVGHIFKLGDKYSRAMNAQYLDENGKAQPFIMGCYGFGISRILPAILEQKSDELGCVWSKEVNIFEVVIIISNIKDSAQSEYARQIYEKLKQEGIDVLLDERDERFGAKMKDFELLGFNHALIVGKGLNEGKIEFIKREGLERQEMPSADKDVLVAQILESIK
ncbi:MULTISPECIES: proline--tRNA ligase [Helicobacter]|uniref:Proline--tRNA ligase n=8 Tax=Helicobacter typhlonius TaxID=76936 RepID=A0A099UCI7_9HELI|nr:MULTISPECIES: proline--tRNA ligase [Helicobacter]TLD78658.1 proline--tRNA ligase [Helicobacter typhlonius]TLD89447.1 proline--tRNA ligase [Helicobacter sp. MIT 03-1616]CUU40073.1 Prolyl-tRNA synthetase, bacterial type [Helicobacter typhlonius]